jgi:PAS domain S-box-containing protein
VVGARGIAVDITERKHLEEELQIAASFPSENPDPVLRLSGDGALLYANDAGRKVLGEYPDNLDTAGGPMLALLRDAATDALKANAIRQIEVDVADHTLEFSVAPIVERQHVNFYGVDITARKHAEELAREHAQSMGIVNQIAAAGNRATSVESFAETVTTLTLELMHLDVGALYLVDDDARCANLQYVRGVPETTIDAIRTISLDDTLCAAFCVEGRAPHIEDRDESCVLCAAVMGLASHARAPLYHHDVCIGELHVGSLTRHAFSQAEKELLTAVGNEVGTVIAKLQADDALKESEQRFRELTDALPVGVYETDETGRFTFVNAAFFDQSGYKREELEAGMSVFQLIAPADRERARTAVRRRMSGEDVGQIEYAGLRKDGSTFPIFARGAPIRRDGAVVGIRGIAADMTEQKRAEETVKEHTHTLEILNHIMTEGHRAFGVQSFAETVTTLTLGLLHFDAGTIHLADEDARCAKLRYVTGLPDSAVEAIRQIPLNEPPYAGFLVEPKPLFLDGHEVSRVPHVAELGLKSLAVVPLYRYDEIIGALNVGSFKRHTFSQAEKDLLNAIGNEVGVVIAKLQADEALKESEKRIREITDALPVVVYETDGTGRLTFVNATAFDLFGYTKEELEAGMTVFQLFTDAYKERAHTVFRRRMSGEDVGRIEYAGLRKDGSTFPVSIRAVLMRRDGAVVGMRGIIVDIAELKRAEDEIKASLKERETLLKEIHHRVKNNMQIISSLISLQADKATERETIEMLDESQSRIRSMALIHEQLYRSSSLADIDFGDYVESLVDELLRMYNIPLGAVPITVDIENVQLGVDTAIPCALIVNELVSNSLKHAFPEGRVGAVTVALQRANGAHTLTVADDGAGFPADVDFRATDSLGMQLVVTLVNQLEGTIELNRENGTAFVISFHVD